MKAHFMHDCFQYQHLAKVLSYDWSQGNKYDWWTFFLKPEKHRMDEAQSFFWFSICNKCVLEHLTKGERACECVRAHACVCERERERERDRERAREREREREREKGGGGGTYSIAVHNLVRIWDCLENSFSANSFLCNILKNYHALSKTENPNKTYKHNYGQSNILWLNATIHSQMSFLRNFWQL